MPCGSKVAKTARRLAPALLLLMGGAGCAARAGAAGPRGADAGVSRDGPAPLGGQSGAGDGGSGDGGAGGGGAGATGGGAGSAGGTGGMAGNAGVGGAGGRAATGGNGAGAAGAPADPVLPIGGGTLKLEVWGERTIRIVYTTPASGTPPASLAVVQTRPLVPFTVEDTATQMIVATAKLTAQVDKATGQVTFLDASGQTIVAEATGTGARSLTAATVSGIATLQSRQAFALSPGESLYGLGQHQQGRATYNGTRQTLQQQNKEIGIPVLTSSRGYGILWDNPAITTVDATSPSALVWSSESASAVDYYFMFGPEIDDVIADYRALTGAPPMFGRWFWGYWQSKEHYATQAELLGVVSGYRSRQLPIDGIVQDWAYWQPAPWGSHSFDPARFPDPAGMVSMAHASHFHVLLSVWAKFESGSSNYDALAAAGALFPTFYQNLGQSTNQTSRWYDPFLPQGRALYWQQMRDELSVKGFDAWWLDATEPELGGNWGEFRTVPTAAGPGLKVFNAYPLMTTKAVSEGQRAADASKRSFILTRSAYAGQQRNGAVSWSGDINGDFATLKAQVPTGIHFSLSGIPYWNTDIGGFFPQTAITSATYQELYTRWFQYGAFCPMFRSHGTGGDKNMWVWGPTTQGVLLAIDQLRYRLLPYIYSLSWQVTSRGYTMMRGLVFDFRNDSRALAVADQFMFGPAFMVNPVTVAGATSRSVYLPAGTTWSDFWTGATTTGGQTVTASAPIDHLPLYVRAGSIVPMGPLMQYATEKPADPVELRVYPGADGTFTLYEDENDNYDYLAGAYATIPMTWSDASKTLTLGARQGSFTGMLQTRTFNVVFVGTGHGTGVAEAPTVDRTVSYDGSAAIVTAP
jgi:alpha-D-xyloside xylohydrolase